jgi:hypothetical protein
MENQKFEPSRTPDFRIPPDLIAKVRESLQLPPEYAKRMEELREALRPVIEGSQRFSEQMREAFKGAFPEGYRFPSWEEQEQAYRERLKMLAEHGWYAAMDFPLVTLNRADAAFREGRETEANEALTEIFDRDAPKIIERVGEEFPETSTLMARALRAHQEGDFVVSVMILLSQAEGIWGRHANQMSPYSRSRKNKAALGRAIEADVVQTPIRAYWELLREDIPINRNFQPGDPIPAVLNRHAVMHGASLDFGTKSNSARTFSWLSYVAEIRGYFGLVPRPSL